MAKARYEHPYVVRLCHWLTAVSLVVMIGSGLEIFRAFPSFSAKIPERDLVRVPSWLGIGGWLGGAIQLHFTFMWLFAAVGVFYVIYQLGSGNYRQVLFGHSDVQGVWPMFRYYFLRGPKPRNKCTYNALQKLAYTTVLALGAFSLITGAALAKPVEFSALLQLLGGFRLVRLEHFIAMVGFLSFIPGHLVMVALHGRSNFASMISGWDTERPQYSCQITLK
jgi:Ni/Fe-hydrogenase b-type cytochrome subunit